MAASRWTSYPLCPIYPPTPPQQPHPLPSPVPPRGNFFIMDAFPYRDIGGRRGEGGGRVSPGRGGDRGYGTIGYYRVLPSDRGTPDTHGECSMVYPRGETAA